MEESNLTSFSESTHADLAQLTMSFVLKFLVGSGNVRLLALVNREESPPALYVDGELASSAATVEDVWAASKNFGGLLSFRQLYLPEGVVAEWPSTLAEVERKISNEQSIPDRNDP